MTRLAAVVCLLPACGRINYELVERSCGLSLERCNGRDDDCDGEVDEGAESALCGQLTSVESAVCVRGECHVDACTPGHADCDGQAVTGCETVLGTAGACRACADACRVSESCLSDGCSGLGSGTWSVGVAGSLDQQGIAISVAPSGKALAAGMFAGDTTVGSGRLLADSADGWLALLDSDGGFLWARRIGGSGDVWLYDAAAVVSAGREYWVVVGSWSGELDACGERRATTSQDDQDIFVALFSEDGDCQPLLAVGGAGQDQALAVVTNGEADPPRAYLTGAFGADVDLGDGLIWSTIGGTRDLFLLALDIETRSVLWSATDGTTYDDRGAALAVRGGEVLLGGTRAAHAFVRAYDAETGAPRAPWAPESEGASAVLGMAVDSRGRLGVAGYFNGTIDFGADPITTRGNLDAFVAVLAPTGSLEWAYTIGGGREDVARAFAFDSDDRAYAIGDFEGQAQFPTGVRETADTGADVFVVSSGVDGMTRWAVTAGAAGRDEGRGVAVGSHDELLVVGTFAAGITFGAHGESSAGASDAYIAALRP